MSKTTQVTPLFGESNLINVPEFEQVQQAVKAPAPPVYFFPTKHNETGLHYLQNMTSKRDTLALITGCLGSGKSLLLDQFLQRCDSTQVTHYCASSSTRLADIATTLAGDFETGVGINMAEQVLQPQLSALQLSDQPCLLLVDDAHCIGTDTLQQLVQAVIGQRRDSIGLHLVLLGEASLSTRVNAILEDLGHTNVPEFDLPALTLEESYDFVQHYFQCEGIVCDKILTAPVLSQIYRLSGGVPGRLKRVSRQAAVDPNQFMHFDVEPKKPKNATSFQFRGVRIISVIVLMLLGLMGWAYYQLEFSQHASVNKPITIPAKLAVLNTMPAMKKAAAEEIKTVEMPAAQASSPEPVEPLIILAKPDASPAAPLSQTDTLTMPKAKIAEIAPPAVATLPKKPVVKAKVEHKKVATAAEYSNAEKSLLAQHGFTIQVLGVSYPHELINFVNQLHVDKPVLFYQTERNQHPWYVVLYGPFATANDAHQAINKLPKSIQDLHPWVRSLTSVHKSIHKGHQHS